MGKPSYLITNNIQDSGGISTSSADSVFVVTNLFGGILGKPFRWSEAISSSLVLHIEIDFGIAKAADMIAIMNHNFASDTTFELKTGAAASPSTVTAVPLWREKDIWISFTDPTARFYRLEITLGTIVPPVPIPEIGELCNSTSPPAPVLLLAVTSISQIGVAPPSHQASFFVKTVTAGIWL